MVLAVSEYEAMSEKTLDERIAAARRVLGESVLILGHHYQKESVIRHCDQIGDSFQLSAAAAANTACKAIVFCGVHFMAETADILVNTALKRRHRLAAKVPEFIPVVLPDPKAGCSMADMASIDQILWCWNELGEVVDLHETVPVTYVNSAASVKAFCGRHGGLACTSSNASSVLRSIFTQKSESARILFFPDQHLGRNTALAMGMPEDRLVLWKPDETLGGSERTALERARIVLWDGYCCVHQHFLPEHVDAVRKAYPGIRVIVHPECPRAVVEKADEFGSTGRIVQAVGESPSGSCWAIGTEHYLIERLAKQYPDKTIVSLATSPSFCSTMRLITPANLCRSLEMIKEGLPENVIRVGEDIASDALLCLQRMLANP